MRFIYVFTVLILLSLSAMAQDSKNCTAKIYGLHADYSIDLCRAIVTVTFHQEPTPKPLVASIDGSMATADIKPFDCLEAKRRGFDVKCDYPVAFTQPVETFSLTAKGTGSAIPKKSTTQSSDGPGFQMFAGATLGTATGGGPFVNSDTIAGGFVDPRASFRLFGATVTARGFMAVENGVRYAPGSTDAVLNFVPGMYVGLPLGGNWSFLVGGAADLQRVQGTTIMNPMMSFGVARNTRDSGQTIVVSYLYDDVVDNGLPQQVFRGYRISPELQKWKGGIGFLAGVDIDRQAQAGLLTTGPRTQAKIRIGVGFRPVPTN